MRLGAMSCVGVVGVTAGAPKTPSEPEVDPPEMEEFGDPAGDTGGYPAEAYPVGFGLTGGERAWWLLLLWLSGERIGEEEVLLC